MGSEKRAVVAALIWVAALAACFVARHLMWVFFAPNKDCANYWMYPTGCPAEDQAAAALHIVVSAGVAALVVCAGHWLLRRMSK